MNEREIILRSNCYKLLAGCFYEPEKDLLLGDRVCENLENLMRDFAPEAAAAASAMATALGGQSEEALRVDYAALFVGPFTLIAAPYGSVYLDKGRRVMGDSTLRVLRFYQDAGLAVEVDEPPDHVAVELEFLYYLTDREALALAAGLEGEAAEVRDIQRRFFFTCFQPWVFEFCRLIRAGSANSFYIGLADCLAGFLSACEQDYALQATAAAR